MLTDRLTTDHGLADVLKPPFAILVYMRLKQYEDTGCSPEDIAKLNRRIKTLEKMTAEKLERNLR